MPQSMLERDVGVRGLLKARNSLDLPILTLRRLIRLPLS